MTHFQTADEAARHYWQTLNSPANAWGRHIDATGRDSTGILHAIGCQFGHVEAAAAIERNKPA